MILLTAPPAEAATQNANDADEIDGKADDKDGLDPGRRPLIFLHYNYLLWSHGHFPLDGNWLDCRLQFFGGLGEPDEVGALVATFVNEALHIVADDSDCGHFTDVVCAF